MTTAHSLSRRQLLGVAGMAVIAALLSWRRETEPGLQALFGDFMWASLSETRMGTVGDAFEEA